VSSDETPQARGRRRSSGGLAELERAPAGEQHEETLRLHGDQTDGRSLAGQLTEDPQHLATSTMVMEQRKYERSMRPLLTAPVLLQQSALPASRSVAD
jgi:hypothetical protein